MQRRTATPANFLRRFLHPQPVAPLQALRIQTLHRPAGHILHHFICLTSFFAGGRKGSELAAETPP
jgi:hypothetical protein